MVSTVIYDGDALPIYISSAEVDLAGSDWTAYLFRDEESKLAIPKSSFTSDEGVYSYTVPAATMATLAKGMYSIRVDCSEGKLTTDYVLSLNKDKKL